MPSNKVFIGLGVLLGLITGIYHLNSVYVILLFGVLGGAMIWFLIRATHNGLNNYDALILYVLLIYTAFAPFLPSWGRLIAVLVLFSVVGYFVMKGHTRKRGEVK